MSCCGNHKHRPPSNVATPNRTMNRPVLFEYDGPSSLTTFGRATGIRYHFPSPGPGPGPGARARVDPRDAPILEVIRGLRVVSQP